MGASLKDELDRRLTDELLAGLPGDLPVPEAEGLHVCRRCERPFVCPHGGAQPTASGRVLVRLRCANCAWQAPHLLSTMELADLECQVDLAAADLAWALELLWLANEEEAISRFATALAADALLPEDF